MTVKNEYLNQLIDGKDLNLIKVITGVRRSGKSTLLLQYKDYLKSLNLKEENIVFIELLRRGYAVHVGKFNDIEIDFIASKTNETIYYQVSRSIMDEIVEEREKKFLLAVNDNYRKVILTMDKVKNKQIDGIDVINIVDFLLDNNA